MYASSRERRLSHRILSRLCWVALLLSGVCLIACEATPSECEAGSDLCGGTTCVSLKTDAKNCGACGSACKDGESCKEGKCVAGGSVCAAGEEDCSGTCADTKKNTAHCGACGNACDNGNECVDGKCQKPADCEDGKLSCGGSCVDTNVTDEHCGECDNACPSGTFCEAGKCECSDGKVACEGSCVDAKSDADNCGGCGKKCGDGQSCKEGACECDGGKALCDSICVDTDTDTGHCGGCGNKCSAAETCNAGKCENSCGTDELMCGDSCVNVKTSKDHCGTCDAACGSGESCKDGSCKKDCPSGQVDCGGSCVDTQSDKLNCGGCGTICSVSEVCDAGVCKSGCAADEKSCGGSCVNIKTDAKHCGDCGQACASGEVCAEGACKAKCIDGKKECNGGCVDTNTDEKNCGTCGTTCAATESCKAGVCKSNCTADEIACNGACVNIKTDAQHCGQCGTACPSGEVCNNGSCGIACPTGKRDCNGSCVDVQTDKNNCGTCGIKCSATEACNAGKCESTCATGEKACSGACTNTDTDDNHCGTCGNACGTGKECRSGACIKKCPKGTSYCSASQSCFNLNSDRNNCGFCGTTCGNGKSCIMGTCKTSSLDAFSAKDSLKMYSISRRLTTMLTAGQRIENNKLIEGMILRRKVGANAATTNTFEQTPYCGFNVHAASRMTYTSTVTRVLGKWSTSSSAQGIHNTLCDGKGLNLNTGLYTVPRDGYYYFTARARIDNAVGLTQLMLQAKLKGGKTSIVRTYHDNISRYRTLRVSGVFFLSAGETVVLAMQSNDSNYDVNASTSFSGVYLGSTLPSSFSYALTTAKTYSSTKGGWITGWKLNQTSDFDTRAKPSVNSLGGFDAEKEGYYLVMLHATVFIPDQISGSTSTPKTVEVQIDSDPGGTTYKAFRTGRVGASFGGRKGTLTTVKMHQVMYMKRTSSLRQKLAFETNGGIVAAGSRITFLYLGAAGEGMQVQLKNEQTYGVGSFQVKGFHTPLNTDHANANFDATNGVFTAPDDGVYHMNFRYAIAGASVSSASQNYYRVYYRINGNRSYVNGTSAIRSWRVPSDSYSVTSLLTLKKGDKVTIYVHSHLDTSFKLTTNSTWSIAYVQSRTPTMRGVHASLDGSRGVYIAGHGRGVMPGMGTLRIPGERVFVAKGTTEDKLDALNYYMPGYVSDTGYGSNQFVVAGMYTGNWKTLTTTSNDGFLMGIFYTGTTRWSIPFKDTGTAPHDMRVFVSGSSIYVVGRFSGTLTAGTKTVSAPAGATSAIYVASVNLAGVQWVKAINAKTASGIASDGSGNVYVVGTFNQSMTWGSKTITSSGDDVFVAKMTSTGAADWIVQTKRNNGTIQSAGLAIIGGTIHVGGHFAGAYDFMGSGTSQPASKQGLFWLGVSVFGDTAYVKTVVGDDDTEMTRFTGDATSGVLMTLGTTKASTLSFGAVNYSKVPTHTNAAFVGIDLP